MAQDYQDLIAAARDAAQKAHCPYSNFPVGAAVRADDGRTFKGCNIENASYGLTICAERVALFAAISAGARRLVAIVVTCSKGDPQNPATLMPCGACRQVMQELLLPDAQVIVDRVGTFTQSALLPTPFELPDGAAPQT